MLHKEGMEFFQKGGDKTECNRVYCIRLFSSQSRVSFTRGWEKDALFFISRQVREKNFLSAYGI